LDGAARRERRYLVQTLPAHVFDVLVGMARNNVRHGCWVRIDEINSALEGLHHRFDPTGRRGGVGAVGFIEIIVEIDFHGRTSTLSVKGLRFGIRNLKIANRVRIPISGFCFSISYLISKSSFNQVSS
jgi:hypothetical protein